MVAIRRRFPVILLAVIGTVSALLAGTVTVIIRSRPAWKEEESLRVEALSLAAALAEETAGDPSVRYDPEGAFVAAVQRKLGSDAAVLELHSAGRRAKVIDRHGGVLLDTVPASGRTERGGVGEKIFLTVSVPVPVSGAAEGVLTMSAESPDRAAGYRRETRMLVAAVVGAGTVLYLALLVAFFRETGPHAALAGYSRTIGEGGEGEPPNLSGTEFEAVARRLEEAKKSIDGTQYVAKYVQTLTHEMKSPLSVLRGAAELLEEEMDPAEHALFIGNMRRETERIQDLVDRLLQLSAIEGRRELRDVENITLASLVREVAGGMGPFLASKGISPDFDLDESTAVWGERFLLRQAVANILKNAVEFSPRGGALGLRLRSDGRYAEIAVEDAGPGIPDYALGRVFEKFYSLARPDTGRRSSGLGLPFAREAVLLHGGEVTVENMAGGGVAVRLRIPLEPPSA